MTLGDPPDELISMLVEVTRDGFLNWVLIPVPERPDITSLREPTPVAGDFS